MPVASGYGRWPSEYGVGVKGERLNSKCSICVQKNCFSCEHLTPVKNSIFQHEPYLEPMEKYSIADKTGTVANYKKSIDNLNKNQNKNGSFQQDGITTNSNQTNQSSQKPNSNNNNNNSNVRNETKTQKKNPSNQKEQPKPQVQQTKQGQDAAKKSTCTIL